MTQAPSDLASELAALHGQLLGFARLQLRNDQWAQDAVSETVIAVLEKPDAFASQSSLKTYVIGILKHKIIDQLRRVQREVQVVRDDDGNDEDAFDALFAADGHWRSAPRNWGDPEESLVRSEF